MCCWQHAICCSGYGLAALRVCGANRATPRRPCCAPGDRGTRGHVGGCHLSRTARSARCPSRRLHTARKQACEAGDETLQGPAFRLLRKHLLLACLGSTQAAGRAGAGAARCAPGVLLYTESPFVRWGHPGAGRGWWRCSSMQLPAERREVSDLFCTQHWPQHISLEAHLPCFGSPGARGSLCCAAVPGVLPQPPAPWRRVAPLGRIMG